MEEKIRNWSWQRLIGYNEIEELEKYTRKLFRYRQKDRKPRHIEKFEMEKKMKTQKMCSGCGKLKDLDDFPIDKRYAGGHSGVCRQCKNLYYKEKYREDSEKYKEKNKIWRENHPEYVERKNRKYRETHKEHIKKLHQIRYQKKREELIAKSKAYIEEHKDEIRIKKKIYRDSHKKEISRYNKRYRERKKLERGG